VHELTSPAPTFVIGIEVKRFLNIKLSGFACIACLMLIVCDIQQASAQDKGDKVATVGKPADQAQAPNPAEKKPYAKEAVEHYNRGLDLQQSGFINQALAEYKSAIDADARMDEAYSNLGVIYAAQHSYAKAKDAFTEALKLKPNRPTTLNGLGTVLYAQKKFDEAKDMWLRAVTIDPNFASAYYNIGNAYESENKPEQAKKAFLQAIGVNPSMADAYYRLGVIMYKQHHYPQAGAMLRRAMLFGPEGEFITDAKRMTRNIDHELDRVDTAAKEAPAKTSKSTKPAAATASKDKSGSTDAGGGAKSVNMFIQPGQDKGTADDSSK
jgi:tetratricopeptide (TPR) repeat protein